MTKDEYNEARGELILLLDRHENLFESSGVSSAHGQRLAQAYWGFIETFTELKKQKVQG